MGPAWAPEQDSLPCETFFFLSARVSPKAGVVGISSLTSRSHRRQFLSFPSLIPRDLPFLSRQLDFAPLNDGSLPSKVNVYTADEAKETWLA